MILYFAADLIWATRIKEAATDLGIGARPVRNVEMLQARLADSPVTALLVDLDAGDAAVALIEAMREHNRARRPEVRVVAWGPHVAKELFQRARDAGADEVLTRGAFDHALADVLLKLGTPRGA